MLERGRDGLVIPVAQLSATFELLFWVPGWQFSFSGAIVVSDAADAKDTIVAEGEVD
jgi:hypothetical protein